MNKVKFFTLFLISMFFLSAITTAMEWPLSDGELVHNFGFNNRGKPVLGTVFEGEGEVNAAGSGRIIFSSTDNNNAASRLPFTLGSWTAIDHENGLVSIYSRYDDINGGENIPTYIEKGQAIASLGSSGWSEKKGLYFILFDRKERRWINPSLVISPFDDSSSPQISGIQLRGANGRVIESSQLRNLSQGRYSIEVNASDILTETNRLPLAPHRIICSVNGEEVGVLSFDTISARGGILMVNRNSLMPAARIYGPYPFFEVAEVQLNRGQVLLEIIVLDIAGNSRSSLLRLVVE